MYLVITHLGDYFLLFSSQNNVIKPKNIENAVQKQRTISKIANFDYMENKLIGYYQFLKFYI